MYELHMDGINSLKKSHGIGATFLVEKYNKFSFYSILASNYN